MSLTNEDDGTASLILAMSVAAYFDVDAARAKAKEVAQAIAKWGTAAAKAAVKDEEINRMGSAFEHTDLKKTPGTS
jgi:serine/threonine-protein kinase HipA